MQVWFNIQISISVNYQADISMDAEVNTFRTFGD